MSLRELASAIGVSAAFLSDVELGRRHPSEKVLKDLARVLGTSVEDLKRHDMRPPIDDLRRLAAEDPRYGLAFRLVRDKKVTPDDLIRLAEGKPARDRKK
jgi:transcriptional regulator with XRE-family HTH domain